jgi:hypothetical protein
MLTAVGLNVLRLSAWFLPTARAQTRLTPFARRMAAGVPAELSGTSPAVSTLANSLKSFKSV